MHNSNSQETNCTQYFKCGRCVLTFFSLFVPLSFLSIFFPLSFIPFLFSHCPSFFYFLNYINFSIPFQSPNPIEPIIKSPCLSIFFLCPFLSSLTSHHQCHRNPLYFLASIIYIIEWQVAIWLGHAQQVAFMPFFIVKHLFVAQT